MIHEALRLLKEEQRKLAEEAMLYSKAEPFEHGVQVGVYRGVGVAHDILESMLRDEIAKEQSQ